MPAMVRSNKKCTKIAYALLGKPDNFANKKKRVSKTERALDQEDTALVK